MKPMWILLLVSLLLANLICPAAAQTVIFAENFDELPLSPPVDEESGITQAFTHQPPVGWQVIADEVPGVGNPTVGVQEWEGWSFANKNFWIEVSNDERRSEFKRGRDTVAVADPDEWNDLGNPANNVGFYNTFLETPVFNLAAILAKGDRLQFKLDSSWIPQCCDDGELFDPNENNKTATVLARFEDGSTVELLRWESAPFTFTDALGDVHPSTNPADDPNPFFKSIATDELVFLDLSAVLNSDHIGFKLEFGLTGAGDDWWWAMDNMQTISLTTVPGDMDLNSVVDEQDIDDFAQAIHSTQDYIATHFGEFPAVRGSLDSVFDFDDIDWFVDVLNEGGTAASRTTILAAIEAQTIPEPCTGCLATLLLGIGIALRRRRVDSFSGYTANRD